MSRDATPADLNLVRRLYGIIEGLPKRLQAQYFHNHHNQVHIKATHLQVARRLGYEEALFQATEEVVPRSMAEGWDLIWIERRAILQEAREGLRKRCRSLRQRLMRRPAPKRYTPPRFVPENAIRNNPRLLAHLRARYGEATVVKLSWPTRFCHPDEYLGCADVEGRLVFAVGMEAWETGGPLSQRRLRQLGRLLDELEYERVVSYYEVDLAELHVSWVATHKVYWNDYEAVLFPIANDVDLLPEHEALTERIKALCENWLVSQGVQHLVELSIDDLDYDSSMRALLPAKLWWTFGIAPPPDQVKITAQNAFVTFVGRKFELPYFTVRQLTWTLFPLFVALIIGSICLASFFTPEAAAPVDARDLPPGPPLLLEDEPPEPLTWLTGFKIAGLLLTLLSPFIAFGAVCYLAMYMLAHMLCVSTPLGTPKEERYTVYVSGDT